MMVELAFPLGSIYMTPGAIGALGEAGQSPLEFIAQRARLEQGEFCDEDHRESLYSGDKCPRVFSAFKTARGVKLWVITEART